VSSTPTRVCRLIVNGDTRECAISPATTLLEALRYGLGLTGSKQGCDKGDCGACTVLLDGCAIYACLRLAVDCEGHHITTIEGIAQHGELDPVQQAFIDADAFQCGFCTAGQIMSLKGLLNETPSPTEAQLRRAVTGNLCRCGAYLNILQAGRLAAGADVHPQEMNDADPTH